MGRATAGVKGMKFRTEDELLTTSVIEDDAYVFTITDGGFAKRTTVDEYRTQNRGGFGIKVANLPEARGELVGAMVVEEDEQVLVVMSSGNVVRSDVSGVPARGRDTMGVIFAKPRKRDRILKVAKSSGAALAAEEGDADEETDQAPAEESQTPTPEAEVQDPDSSQ